MNKKTTYYKREKINHYRILATKRITDIDNQGEEVQGNLYVFSLVIQKYRISLDEVTE